MFFALMFMFVSPAMGADVDYVDLVQGDTAPFDGKLLKNKALAEIITKHQSEIEKLNIESKYDLKQQELDLNLKYDTLQLKYASETEMYKTMIETRDQQLNKDVKKDVIQRWVAYGAFALGAASSIAIFHAVDSN
jgi:hypothetical protein